jgi:hypothetical protein
MYRPIALFDVVALIHDRATDGLVRGQVGTVVEVLPGSMFEVEFSDDQGKTYALLPLAEDELIVLHMAPVRTA